MSKTPAPMTTTNTKNRPRLGRGLSSLISLSDLPVEAELQVPIPLPVPSSPPVPTSTVSAPVAISAALPTASVPGHHPTEIPIDSITPNPHQPRKEWNEATIAELAASIKSTGLIQPIVVRKVADGYQLVAGERRWRASKLAGLTALPAIVREIDGFAQAQMALVENIQREDLNPIDRAQGYRTLIQQLGLTQAELASRLGEDRSSIANFLRLLDLAEPVKAMVRDNRLSVGHAKLIAGVADVLEQERLANLVVSQGLSVRNLERVMQDASASSTPKAAPASAAPSAHLQDLEKSIARQLGMRVQVRSSAKKGKGRLVIHYASLDQFDQLMQKLGVQTD